MPGKGKRQSSKFELTGQVTFLFANVGTEDILLREELDSLAAASEGRIKIRYIVETPTQDEGIFAIGRATPDLIRSVIRARFMTGGGYRLLASANFGELGCIEAKFCKRIVNARWKALAEIYTMHFFAPFSNLNFSLKFADIFF